LLSCYNRSRHEKGKFRKPATGVAGINHQLNLPRSYFLFYSAAGNHHRAKNSPVWLSRSQRDGHHCLSNDPCCALAIYAQQ